MTTPSTIGSAEPTPTATARRTGASPIAAETGYVSEESTLPPLPVTEWPGEMHSGAQSVVRDGVQVLTDRPEESDDPVPGRHRTYAPKPW